MRTGAFIYRDLKSSARRLSGAAISVAASVALVFVLSAVGLGVGEHVVGPLLPRLPLNLLKVEPAQLDLGIFSVDATKLGGGFDDAALTRMARIPGVARVYGVRGSAFPMRASGGQSFLGRRVYADIFATAVEPALVQADVAAGQEFSAQTQGYVPVLVARRLLDLYNTSIAAALHKPQLSKEAVIGFQFQLQLGVSHSRGVPDPSRVRSTVARIVGFSEQANLLGITLPKATMEAWNREYDQGAGPLVGAYVKTTDPAAAGGVTEAVERMGLRVDESSKLIGAAVAVAAALAGLFFMILLALSAFGISQTFAMLIAERKQELAVLRALGASRSALLRLVLAEALVVGLVAGLVGTGLGLLAALGLERLALSALPALSFKPAALISTPPSLLLGAWALGALASLVGAIRPALTAAAADPARALRD